MTDPTFTTRADVDSYGTSVGINRKAVLKITVTGDDVAVEVERCND